MAKNFESTFKKNLLLEIAPQQDAPTQNSNVQQPPQNDDAAAWRKSLGPETDPNAFDAAHNPNHAVKQQNIEVAKQWVQKIDDFKKFINGLEPESLHAQINQMDRDGSVFRGIVKSEQRKIIKIAEALGSFNEILRSYILSADKKARELNAQTSKSQ